MANRDEARALKDRKPIDYHMFLSNKFNKHSILQYNDHIDRKCDDNNRSKLMQKSNEHDDKENRVDEPNMYHSIKIFLYIGIVQTCIEYDEIAQTDEY